MNSLGHVDVIHLNSPQRLTFPPTRQTVTNRSRALPGSRYVTKVWALVWSLGVASIRSTTSSKMDRVVKRLSSENTQRSSTVRDSVGPLLRSLRDSPGKVSSDRFHPLGHTDVIDSRFETKCLTKHTQPSPTIHNRSRPLLMPSRDGPKRVA